MSKKKIVVPEGMLKAVWEAHSRDSSLPMQLTNEQILLAALGWLSENPIVPTDMWIQDEIRMAHSSLLPTTLHCRMIAEWQRRMFLAPEPEVPEAVKSIPGICLNAVSDQSELDRLVAKLLMEAYRRGLQAEKPRVATYRKCARPDCTNPPFKVGKREKIYCSHSCAHLMAVRASRKRHPKGKA